MDDTLQICSGGEVGATAGAGGGGGGGAPPRGQHFFNFRLVGETTWFFFKQIISRDFENAQ